MNTRNLYKTPVPTIYMECSCYCKIILYHKELSRFLLHMLTAHCWCFGHRYTIDGHSIRGQDFSCHGGICKQSWDWVKIINNRIPLQFPRGLPKGMVIICMVSGIFLCVAREVCATYPRTRGLWVLVLSVLAIY